MDSILHHVENINHMDRHLIKDYVLKNVSSTQLEVILAEDTASNIYNRMNKKRFKLRRKAFLQFLEDCRETAKFAPWRKEVDVDTPFSYNGRRRRGAHPISKWVNCLGNSF